jgi:predicted acyl esterase
MTDTGGIDHELEVTGPITVRLWIASDAPDPDFTAKLIDVYPPSADFPARLRDEPSHILLPIIPSGE